MVSWNWVSWAFYTVQNGCQRPAVTSILGANRTARQRGPVRYQWWPSTIVIRYYAIFWTTKNVCATCGRKRITKQRLRTLTNEINQIMTSILRIGMYMYFDP